MAIFSLHHSFVGRSTHPAGAASAYARYATRNEACTVVLSQRMPADGKVYSWLDQQEQDDRKNARVVDRVTVALPRELSRDQNIQLLQDYCERMTHGRASWMAAIHDGPGDADNPHAHIVFRDRDMETGRRVMMTSEPGSTQRFRQGWEEEVNLALERADLEQRVDSRSLEAQGVDREPQLHVGPAAQRLAEGQHEFRSSEQQVTRLIDGVPTEITINYPAIDEGKTRFEENEERKLRNWVREQERLALEGPQRPDAHPMERVVDSSLRLDAIYRRAVQSGEVPADDGTPITAVIREHMAERGAMQIAKAPPGLDDGRPFAPVTPATLESSRALPDDSELKLRKAELEKLKQEPGMGEVLRGRDYLNALTFERGEPAPSPADLHSYLVWQRENRLPIPEEAREEMTAQRVVVEAGERGPRKDGADLVAGAGLAVFDKLATSLETLFDNRSPQEIEKDDKLMADQRKIEQITEQQQRQQEAELAKWRQIELELYLAQRDRERHIDRGR